MKIRRKSDATFDFIVISSLFTSLLSPVSLVLLLSSFFKILVYYRGSLLLSKRRNFDHFYILSEE